MKQNIGQSDKIARIVVGIILVASGLLFKSWWGIIGLLPIATAFIGVCPAYIPLGISTCQRD